MSRRNGSLEVWFKGKGVFITPDRKNTRSIAEFRRYQSYDRVLLKYDEGGRGLMIDDLIDITAGTVPRTELISIVDRMENLHPKGWGVEFKHVGGYHDEESSINDQRSTIVDAKFYMVYLE
jgi:hypothetical protein